jgi:hypothetical protein
MQTLGDIQRRLQSAVVGEMPGAAEMLLPSSTMSAEERLAVYQYAYIARLVECMRAEFPVLCRAVEQEPFDDLAAMFVATHPPTSYTLIELGRAFPAFLAANMPADLPGRQALAELAELEWLTNEVFNGPGVEQEPPLDLAEFVPENWETLRLALAPCVRLMQVATPVHEYYRQLRAEQTPAPPSNLPAWLVISRRDYTVQHHNVSESLFVLLNEMQAGKPLAEVIAMLAMREPNNLDELSANLHEWFRWIAAHQIAIIRA